MSNYTFDGLNLPATKRIATIKSQARSAGVIIPQLYYIGRKPSFVSDVLHKTKELTSSSIIARELFVQNVNLYKRAISSELYIESDNVFFEEELQGVFIDKLLLYAEQNDNLNKVFFGKTIRDIGSTFLSKDGEFLKLTAEKRIFQTREPSYDLLYVDNINPQERFVCLIREFSLKLLNKLNIYQPENNEDKDNAYINPLHNKFYWEANSNLDLSFVINSNLWSKKRFVRYADNNNRTGIHRFKLDIPDRSGDLELESIVEAIKNNYILPRQFENIEHLSEKIHSFTTLNRQFSYNYINMMFYITYIELFETLDFLKRDLEIQGQYFNNLIIVILSGMIYYAIKYNDINFSNNKILIPEIKDGDLIELERKFTDFFERDGSSLKSLNDFNQIFEFTKSNHPYAKLTKTIYNLKFVKENLNLICKCITFIKPLGSDVVSYDKEEKVLTISSNNIFNPTSKVSPPPTFEDSDFDEDDGSDFSDEDDGSDSSVEDDFTPEMDANAFITQEIRFLREQIAIEKDKLDRERANSEPDQENIRESEERLSRYENELREFIAKADEKGLEY